jgi:hypothetical protein
MKQTEIQFTVLPISSKLFYCQLKTETVVIFAQAVLPKYLTQLQRHIKIII